MAAGPRSPRQVPPLPCCEGREAKRYRAAGGPRGGKQMAALRWAGMRIGGSLARLCTEELGRKEAGCKEVVFLGDTQLFYVVRVRKINWRSVRGGWGPGADGTRLGVREGAVLGGVCL